MFKIIYDNDLIRFSSVKRALGVWTGLLGQNYNNPETVGKKELEIINILKENDLSDVEVLKNEEEYVLVNFYFDFDKDLQDAAKAYANSESNEEEFSNAWYNEYYFPYLYDFANDEVLEVIEQVIETLDVEGEMMAFQMTEKTSDYVQVMALFTEEDSNVVIEDVVREYIAK